MLRIGSARTLAIAKPASRKRVWTNSSFPLPAQEARLFNKALMERISSRSVLRVILAPMGLFHRAFAHFLAQSHLPLHQKSADPPFVTDRGAPSMRSRCVMLWSWVSYVVVGI